MAEYLILSFFVELSNYSPVSLGFYFPVYLFFLTLWTWKVAFRLNYVILKSLVIRRHQNQKSNKNGLITFFHWDPHLSPNIILKHYFSFVFWVVIVWTSIVTGKKDWGSYDERQFPVLMKTRKVNFQNFSRGHFLSVKLDTGTQRSSISSQPFNLEQGCSKEPKDAPWSPSAPCPHFSVKGLVVGNSVVAETVCPLQLQAYSRQIYMSQGKRTIFFTVFTKLITTNWYSFCTESRLSFIRHLHSY